MSNNVLDEIDRRIILYKKTRDKEYFNQACTILYPYLLDYAAKLIKENSLKQYVGDIVSDTVLKMHKKTLDYYTHYSNAYYYDWCCSLLRSVKSDYMRNVVRVAIINYTDDIESDISKDYRTETENDLIEKKHREQLHNILSDSISGLSEIKRRVIEEIYLKKKSYKEVSESMHITIHRLKYYVYEAKNDLKRDIARKHPDI